MKLIKYLPIFLMCACSLQYERSTKYEQKLSDIVAYDAFVKNYKGIILFETHNNLSTGGLNPRNILEFESDGGAKFEIDLLGKNYSISPNVNSFAYITPGKYKLVSASAYDYASYGNRSVWISETYHNIDASFTVNPGEIVYLGNLIFNVTGNDIDYEWLGHKNNLIYDVSMKSNLSNKEKDAIEKLFNRPVLTRLMEVSHK
ncbi:MAG: hypothetical protein K6F04_04075 [bacterium]|nr:hypothetical protein [bacterium]